MKRGLVLSAVAHAALFVLVLAGPRPGTQAWELPEAIPVTLVSAVEEPAAEPPREEPPPAPEPEKQTEVEPEVDRSEPEPESEPPPPEPVSKPREIRRRPPRTYHPYAPERRDEPSLAERLQARLEDTEAEPAEAAATPEHAAAPASSTSAHSTEVEAGDSDFPFAWYLNLLRTKITDSWDPPGDRLIAGRSRQVIVSFRIARDGSVTDVRVQSGSETPGLDASARRAVERAKPFPPLPESYGRDVLDVAVRFTVAEGGR